MRNDREALVTKFFSWQQIPSPVVTEVLSLQHGGIVIDTEHSMWNFETIFASISIGKLNQKTVLVRVHKNDLSLISRVLDAGADGIILSTVETQQDAENFMNSALHTSQGGSRGLGLVRQNLWGEGQLIQPAPILIPQIETSAGISNLESIISPSFSFYLIGPYDLSMSLDDAGNFESPRFTQAIERFEHLLPDYKRAVHVPGNVLGEIEKYRDFGMICLGMDTTSLMEVANENARIVQEIFCSDSH